MSHYVADGWAMVGMIVGAKVEGMPPIGAMVEGMPPIVGARQKKDSKNDKTLFASPLPTPPLLAPTKMIRL